MIFCKKPFEHVEIDGRMDCFLCCPPVTNYLSVGNIENKDINEVWNSEIAQKIRASILDGSFKYCNLGKCTEYPKFKDKNVTEISPEYKIQMEKMPKEIYLDYDYFCNARCIFCRDNWYVNNKKDLDLFNKIADNKILPLLKDAEIVYLNGFGEVFYSDHAKYFINKVSELYPKIAFNISSNGILCTKENMVKMGLFGKINDLTISVHAATAETHEKIFRVKAFDKVKENIAALSKMLVTNELKFVQLIFVVNSVNYREMPKFAEMAEKLGVSRYYFCEYFRTETEMGKNAEDYMVFLPNNPEHKEFLEVLCDKRLTPTKKLCFSDGLLNLRNKMLTEKAV